MPNSNLIYSKMYAISRPIYRTFLNKNSLCKIRSIALNFSTSKSRQSIIYDVPHNKISPVKSDESVKSLSTFQQLMHQRKKQAECSVLLEMQDKDLPHAVCSCQRSGAIRTVFSYSGESNHVYLLIEFEDATSVQNLLSHSECSNITDAFPTTTRMLRFKKRFPKESAKLTLKIHEDKSMPSKLKGIKSISEIIEHLYISERLSELNIRLRFFFCSLIRDSISGLFPRCEVFPFGSTVNGVGKEHCDLDLMIRQYPAQVISNSEFSFLNKTCIGSSRELQKRSVFALGEYFGTFMPGIFAMKKIVHARIPILKFSHKILNMECDISVNNMSAVLMSEILFFCGEIDSRFRPLVFAVKKWAKDGNITFEAPGAWITNFALTMLVIHFLQNRPIPILPPLIDAIHIVGAENTTPFEVEYLASLPDLQSKAALNKESLAMLLLEFLSFLGSTSFHNQHISLLTGQTTPYKSDNALWVQYPLEEDMNVSKNVALNELRELCEKANLSADYLAANIRQKGSQSNDLSVLLGVPSLSKIFAHKLRKPELANIILDKNRRSVKKSF